jgi:hypothetical protein
LLQIQEKEPGHLAVEQLLAQPEAEIEHKQQSKKWMTFLIVRENCATMGTGWQTRPNKKTFTGIEYAR